MFESNQSGCNRDSKQAWNVIQENGFKKNPELSVLLHILLKYGKQ